MQEFWFYIQLGLNHVLDFAAYDHILFLSALAIPFTFKNWKQVVLLATIFTIAHCSSLALSVYEISTMDSGLIEFLIPVTILLTAIFNLVFAKYKFTSISFYIHSLATAFFGLVHGFGFSNYFKMLMSEEEEKLSGLAGFATGIEISQVLIILCILAFAFLFQSFFKVKKNIFIIVASIIITGITIPMLINTFPY